MERVAPPETSTSFMDRWLAIAMVLVVAHGIAHLRLLRLEGLASTLQPSPGVVLVLGEVLFLSAAAVLPAVVRLRWLAWPLLAGVAGLMVSGWLSYALTGGFPNLDSLALFLQSPGQVISHGMHFDAASLPWAAAAWAGLTTALIAAHLRPPVLGRRSGAWMCVALLLATQVMLRDGGRLSRSQRQAFDPSTGVTRSYQELWKELQFHGGGVFSSLSRSIRDRALGQVDTFPAIDPRVSVRSMPFGPELPTVPVAKHRWNVLLVVIESLRADELFDTLRSKPTMPQLEAIAGSARRYVNAYATATQTNLAAVVPMSGQYPLRTSAAAAYPSSIPYPRTLIYDRLQQAGWRTGVFSSQNERWWGMHHFLASDHLDTLFDANTATRGEYLPEDDVGFARFVAEGKTSGKLYDQVTVDAAIEWVQRDTTIPFFASINLQASHLPYSTPPGTPRRFGTDNAFPITFGTWPRDSSVAVRDEYRNALAFIDGEIGRLRAALQASGRWDSTIVIVTGDHGQAFYEHDVAAHANGLWQELVRVPLIIRWPGVVGGTEPGLASHIDIPPTIAGLLGLQADDWPGIRLDGRMDNPLRPLFLLVQSPLSHQTGVIYGDYKLTRDLNTRTMRLYDLECDPGETRDLASEGHEVLAAMAALLRTWEMSQLSYYRSELRVRNELPPRVEGLSDPTLSARFRQVRCATVTAERRE